MISLHYTFNGQKHALPAHEFRVNTHSHMEYAYAERPMVKDVWARTVCQLSTQLGDEAIAKLSSMSVQDVIALRIMTCIPRRAKRPASATYTNYTPEEDEAVRTMKRRDAARVTGRTLMSVKRRKAYMKQKGLL